MRRLLVIAVLAALMVGVVAVDAFAAKPADKGADIFRCTDFTYVDSCQTVTTPSGTQHAVHHFTNDPPWNLHDAEAGLGYGEGGVPDPVEGPVRTITTPTEHQVNVANFHPQDTPSTYGPPRRQ